MSDDICVYCNENGVCNNREAPQVYTECSKRTVFGTGKCMFYTPGPSNAVCAHKKDEFISTACKLCENSLLKPCYEPLQTAKTPDDCADYDQTDQLCRACKDPQLMPCNNLKDPPDNVNHPKHYCQGGIECIKAIEVSMTPEEFQGYCKGNVMKYVWRFREKNGLEDLKKAQVYLGWMIESKEKQEKTNAN